ncbi:MAG TPA: efflux transporter periplasmic adaptor subunit, partial [Caulobacteraceae bacterium]|nr:efflux transporter periplasmic adaptor subunit [Caulobacteraceae bacterium]
VVDGLRVIRSGVGLGDRVVIDGVQNAHPGKPVLARQGRIAPEATPPMAPVTAPASSATFAVTP